MGEEAAERLLSKLRAFVAEQLDEEERALFAALVAPGVARAYGEPEVEGFGVAGWSPRPCRRRWCGRSRTRACGSSGWSPSPVRAPPRRSA